MEFINKLAPIVIPLLTAIAGLFTAWFKTRAARAEAKKAEASANTGGYHAEAQRRHHQRQWQPRAQHPPAGRQRLRSH